MVTEEQIKEMAYSLWEQEGRPDGRDQEFYFRAKLILEEREATLLTAIELEPPAPTIELAPSEPVKQLSDPGTH